VRSPLPPKKGPASRRRAAPKTRKRRGKAARAATKAAGKPAAPVTLPTPGHDRYRIRFTSDEALAAVVRDGRAWAHACSSRGSLYLVPPSATGGVALVASECSPAVQAKHGLRPLERPTAALRRALGGIDTEGFRWFLRLERRLAARVEALLAGSPSDGSAKPLVEIDERGEVRLVRKGERMAAR